MSGQPVYLTLQQRLLLDELRHTRGSPISVERIVLALYGSRHDGGPDNAPATIHTQIRNLRRALAPFGARILTIGLGLGAQGYMLDPETLDEVEVAMMAFADADLVRARARLAS